MDLAAILKREAATDFERFRGTRLSGSIPITEAVVDRLSAESGSRLAKNIRIQFQPGNIVTCAYGILRATAVLAEAIDFSGSPKISLRLQSMVTAWALRAALSAPFITFKGTEMTVDLGALPPAAPYRYLVKHIRAVTLRTSDQKLTVNFEVAVQ